MNRWIMTLALAFFPIFQIPAPWDCRQRVALDPHNGETSSPFQVVRVIPAMANIDPKNALNEERRWPVEMAAGDENRAFLFQEANDMSPVCDPVEAAVGKENNGRVRV